MFTFILAGVFAILFLFAVFNILAAVLPVIVGAAAVVIGYSLSFVSGISRKVRRITSAAS